jgi:hypothetical protein
LAEGWQLHRIVRVFEVEPDTVQSYLVKAAADLEALSNYLIHDLPLSQVQVDELGAGGQQSGSLPLSPVVTTSSLGLGRD